MKKYARFLSGALTLVLVSSSTSYAWNGRGHMMVAAVAYKKLTQQTKNRVDALLLLNPDRDNWFDLIPEGTSVARQKMMIFMIAATWADRIKSDPDYHTDGTNNGNTPPNDPSASQNIGYDDLARHKYWHFIDLPFTQDNTPLVPIITPNAQTQINAFRAVLASNSPDALKSYDLSWFLHLIGDVHQPLHCTTRVGATQPKGDDGGNGAKLTTSPGNLHSFWDGVIGKGNTPSTALNAISTLPNAPASAANDLDVGHWINESFEAAKQTVYKSPIGAGAGPFTLNQAYKTTARKLAEKRIALAGARLAKILNEELR
ncbi:MAG: S1/P1 nuclease [Acidobacteria bacterium]|nr:S1/P1 nuclease [Acidobacteriota bacterium]